MWNIVRVDGDWVGHKVLFVIYVAKVLRWLKVHYKLAMGGAPQVAMRVASQIWQIVFALQTLQVFHLALCKKAQYVVVIPSISTIISNKLTILIPTHKPSLAHSPYSWMCLCKQWKQPSLPPIPFYHFVSSPLHSFALHPHPLIPYGPNNIHIWLYNWKWKFHLHKIWCLLPILKH